MYSGNGLEDNLKMERPSSSEIGEWIAETVEAEGLDPLLALARNPGLGQPVGYWEQPAQQVAVAAFGAAAQVQASTRRSVAESLAALKTDIGWGEGPRPMGPWFGGVAFDVAHPPGPDWAGFPASRWTLPEFLLWRRGNTCALTGFARAHGSEVQARTRLREALGLMLQRLERGRFEARPPRRQLALGAERARWDALVARALSAFESGALTKVVGARAIEVSAAEPFDLPELLSALRTRAPSCTTFLFAGEGGRAFIGATPETLCRVRGGGVETEALAGSAPPGAPDDVFDQDKERREHAAVVDAIASGLRTLCDTVELGAPALVRLPNVVHQRTAIRARLRPGIPAVEVVRVLHPTPAVGGTPRDRALAFLREHEGLDRGWYAGAVGWVGDGDAELKVALRSALVNGAQARVFVGAGLVAGSDAEHEWAETEVKARMMLGALGGGDG